MKTTYVWVIEAQNDYEPGEIVGAFASEAFAEETKSRMLRAIGRWRERSAKSATALKTAPPHVYADRLEIHKLRVKS